MKTSTEIYQSLRDAFYNKTSIDIERGTVIDYFVLASSDMLAEAYQEIENNKTPHIYSSLKGQQLDDLGILVGIARRVDESDRNYLYRILNWNVSNKSSNATSIETSLMDMTHCSHATYIPQAFGCGTAAIYIIPKIMTEDGMNDAIEEAKSRLKNVVSPSSYIEYIIPKVDNVKLVVLISDKDLDVRSKIAESIVTYVNGIAPGEYLEIGTINKIGTDIVNVKYFNVGNLFINGVEKGSISTLQKVESKFVMSEKDITWLEVE